MTRAKQINGRQAEYIQDLFRKGRTIAEVQEATGRQWADDTLRKMKALAR